MVGFMQEAFEGKVTWFSGKSKKIKLWENLMFLKMIWDLKLLSILQCFSNFWDRETLKFGMRFLFSFYEALVSFDDLQIGKFSLSTKASRSIAWETVKNNFWNFFKDSKGKDLNRFCSNCVPPKKIWTALIYLQDLKRV